MERRILRRGPLSFAQLAHWQEYRLWERTSIRQVASATRLIGRLDADTFISVARHMVERHEALHTRIRLLDENPVQEAFDATEWQPAVLVLEGGSPAALAEQIHARLAELILLPVNVAADPLFVMQLLRVAPDEHVMLIAIEHSVSDIRSMGILITELLTAYAQVRARQSISLPMIEQQLIDYARWQHDTRADWEDKHGEYWRRKLAGAPGVRFDCGVARQSHVGERWAMLPISIDRDLKDALSLCCRRVRSTLGVLLLSAYAALVMRWCAVPELVVAYQSDGRGLAQIRNTMGYFAAILYLRVGSAVEDSFVDLIRRVALEYGEAQAHADRAYLQSQRPAPAYAANPCFNWIPHAGKAPTPLPAVPDGIHAQDIAFENPMLQVLERDLEPFVVLRGEDDGIQGMLGYRLDRLSAQAMESFRRNFLSFIQELVRDPTQRIQTIALLP